MNNCEENQEKLSAYIDNELGDADTSKLFYHLGECTDCRGTLRSMMQLRSVLREWGETTTVASNKPLFWKRSFVISFPVAAILALFLFLSTMAAILEIATDEQSIDQSRMEYVSSKPLPTYYVIEPSENTIHMN